MIEIKDDEMTDTERDARIIQGKVRDLAVSAVVTRERMETPNWQVQWAQGQPPQPRPQVSRATDLAPIEVELQAVVDRYLKTAVLPPTKYRLQLNRGDVLRAAGGLVDYPCVNIVVRVYLPEARRFSEQNFNAALLDDEEGSDGPIWRGDAAVIEWARGVLAATETP
jgi:hypothetical protein